EKELQDQYIQEKEAEIKSMGIIVEKFSRVIENPKLQKFLLIKPEPLGVVKVQTPRNNASFIMSKRAASSKLSSQS
ncbi:MAG: hypothetical protein ACRD5J_20395, partial [Nitrososphaeraceae archaeon]